VSFGSGVEKANGPTNGVTPLMVLHYKQAGERVPAAIQTVEPADAMPQ